MNLLSLSRLLIAAILFVFSWSTAVLAANVTIVPSGDASYVIQGESMDGVAGMDLTIRYEADLFQGTPAVIQGSLIAGAMLAANTSLRGTIKIAIISTKSFSGSGPIATISFVSKSPTAPLPTREYSLIDSKGSALASSTGNVSTETSAAGTILPPGVPFSQPSSATPPTTPPVTTPAVTATPTYGGTVTLPAEQQQQADSQPSTSPPVPVYTGEPAAPKIEEPTQPSGKPVSDAKIEETPQYVLHKGILDRFKQYSGSKQLSAIASLFDKKVAQTIHQEPAILLSDGQSKATLTVDIPGRITSSPNFAVNGGTLVSFKQDKQTRGRWIVDVLPEVGSIKVTLTIIAGAEEFEFPLTVVPPVNTALTLDEPGWNRFLNEVGTSSAPRHDLNNDGVRDYVDEFIFVANYISGKSAPTKPASPSNKSLQ